MNLKEFIRNLRLEFAIDHEAPVNGSTSLFDELGLDSLDAFHLVLFLEDLADVNSQRDDTPSISTVNDAYSYFVQLTDIASQQAGTADRD